MENHLKALHVWEYFAEFRGSKKGKKRGKKRDKDQTGKSLLWASQWIKTLTAPMQRLNLLHLKLLRRHATKRSRQPTHPLIHHSSQPSPEFLHPQASSPGSTTTSTSELFPTAHHTRQWRADPPTALQTPTIFFTLLEIKDAMTTTGNISDI